MLRMLIGICECFWKALCSEYLSLMAYLLSTLQASSNAAMLFSTSLSTSSFKASKNAFNWIASAFILISISGTLNEIVHSSSLADWLKVMEALPVRSKTRNKLKDSTCSTIVYLPYFVPDLLRSLIRIKKKFDSLSLSTASVDFLNRGLWITGLLRLTTLDSQSSSICRNKIIFRSQEMIALDCKWWEVARFFEFASVRKTREVSINLSWWDQSQDQCVQTGCGLYKQSADWCSSRWWPATTTEQLLFDQFIFVYAIVVLELLHLWRFKTSLITEKFLKLAKRWFSLFSHLIVENIF